MRPFPSIAYEMRGQISLRLAQGRPQAKGFEQPDERQLTLHLKPAR
jgi:hypothetical protein